MNAQADYRVIPIGKLRESPFNPRKHYDPERLLELAASIKQQGVLEPIIVRTMADALDDYEVVAGSRRFRAALMAKLNVVPVIIRTLSDEEALKVCTIENLQREDIHPLEEADGYRMLMKQGGYDVPALAAVVGKSESYIYQRLKLLELEPKVRKAFLAGDITAGHAILLARLTPPDQVLGLEECLENNASVRGLTAWIEDEVHRDLAKVPWDLTDAGLVRKAGACSACSKRSGTQPSLFPDIASRDTCTDPACFKAKYAAFVDLREVELKRAKQEVVRISAGWSHSGIELEGKGQVLRESEYTKAGRKGCEYTKAGLVVAGPGVGTDFRVCTNPKCRVHHPAAPRHEATPAEKKARREGAIDKLVEPRVREAMLRKALAGPKSIADWRVVASCCLDQIYHDDRAQALCEVRGLKYAKSWHGARDAIQKELSRCKSTEALRNWAFQIALTGGDLGDFEDLAKGLGVDVAGLRKQAAAELDAGKGKPKAQPSVPGKAKAERRATDEK